jgi:hypothetical protein
MDKLFLLYSTTNQAEASIIKGMLEENNIPVFLMNKQDSSYLNFGEVEIYVPHDLKEIAQSLLSKGSMN